MFQKTHQNEHNGRKVPSNSPNNTKFFTVDVFMPVPKSAYRKESLVESSTYGRN